jgi:hypothetical protein
MVSMSVTLIQNIKYLCNLQANREYVHIVSEVLKCKFHGWHNITGSAMC